jgi:hypothetical protein
MKKMCSRWLVEKERLGRVKEKKEQKIWKYF